MTATPEQLAHYAAVELEAQQQQELAALILTDATIHKIFQWARHENMDEETMLRKMVVQLAAEKKALQDQYIFLLERLPFDDRLAVCKRFGS